MSFTLFINFAHGGKPAARISAEDDAKLTALLKPIKGLTRAHVYTPSKAHDPFLDDGAPPRLVLQLFFDKLPDLEASVSRTGPLQALATDFPSLADAPMTCEAMVVRVFPTPEPTIKSEPWCSYLVAYEGPAEDPNLWLEHYIAHHPPIMRTMPGIRELEIYTAIDWIGFLPAKKVRHLQRNKTTFDSNDALTAGLQSPARSEMRKDYESFPKFSGGVTHFPMSTRSVRP